MRLWACVVCGAGPDENLVEVWVVAADLVPGALSMGASTFIIVDFFDYESQVGG
jgi:hypothetical protein